MKRTIGVMLALVMALTCLLAGCTPETHEHTFATTWSSDETGHWHAATCGHNERKDVAEHSFTGNTCTVCGYVSESIHVHTFAEAWSHDDAKHWHDAICEHDVKGEEGDHVFSNGKCTVCGYERPGEHVHTFEDTWSFDAAEHWHAANCEHEVRKDAAAHTFKDGKCSVCGYAEPPKYETGDVIEDEEVRSALYRALRADYAGMHASFTGSGEIQTAGEDAIHYSGNAQGEGTFAKASENLDLYTVADYEDLLLQTSGKVYGLAFKRDDTVYAGGGTLEEDADFTYKALLDRYRGEDGEKLYTASGEDENAASYSEILSAALPILTKLAKNSLVYAGGEIVKTDSGYTMSTTGSDVYRQVLTDVRDAFAALKRVTLSYGNNTVEKLLMTPSLSKMISTLLADITAEELTTLIGLLPVDASALPEATEKMTAEEYFWACLRSPDVASALVDLYLQGSDTEDSDFKTLTDALLKNGIAGAQLSIVWIGLLHDSFDRDAIIEFLNERIKAPDADASVLTLLLGENAAGSLDFTMSANFDEAYALTAISFAAEAENVSGEFSYTPQEGEAIHASISDLDGTFAVTVTMGEPAFADLSGVNTQPFPETLPPLEEQGAGAGA